MFDNDESGVGAHIVRPLSTKYLRDIDSAAVVDTGGRAVLAPTQIGGIQGIHQKFHPWLPLPRQLSPLV